MRPTAQITPRRVVAKRSIDGHPVRASGYCRDRQCATARVFANEFSSIACSCVATISNASHLLSLRPLSVNPCKSVFICGRILFFACIPI